MNVIDKILSEWSFRCHDGIVDINDPTKLSILKEILVEEGIEDDILDATLNLPKDDPASEERKRKALAILTGDKDEKDQEIEKLKQQISGSERKKEEIAKELFNIEQKLISKNLKEAMVDYIIYSFIKANKEEDLITYFNLDEDKTKLNVTDGVNIKEIPLKYLPKDIIEKLYKALSGSSGTKGVGKEENFLVAFYNNISKSEKKGDITVDGQKYEVKGVGAMVTPPDIGRGSKKDVIQLLSNEFLPNLNSDQLPEEIFQKNTRWINTISDIYKNYPDKKEFIDKLQSVLNQKYPGLVISDKILKNSDDFSKAISRNLINNFDVEANEKIMFVSSEGEIKIYNTKEDLVKDIDQNIIKISSFSDFVPRLTLPKRKEKIKIGVSNFKENVINNKVSRNWYNVQEKEKQKYFDETKSSKNFIPLKPEYQNTVELVPYASLEEELTDYLIKSFK